MPEAVRFLEQSLKAVPSYKPALMNLGFTALKGGDLKEAKKRFANIQDDWFVNSGMISIARLEGNNSYADRLCSQLLGSRGNHKPTVFNCALHEYQNKKDYKKARSMFEKVARLPSSWLQRRSA